MILSGTPTGATFGPENLILSETHIFTKYYLEHIRIQL